MLEINDIIQLIVFALTIFSGLWRFTSVVSKFQQQTENLASSQVELKDSVRQLHTRISQHAEKDMTRFDELSKAVNDIRVDVGKLQVKGSV